MPPEGPLALLSNVLFFPYQAMMLYGVLTLTSFWAWGEISHRRGHDALMMGLGVVVPVAAWILTLFIPHLFFLMPLSLGFLYIRISAEEALQDEAERRLQREDLEHAERQLKADAKNAVAHWSKAQVYEKQGRFKEALRHYARAHEIDKRTLTDAEMEDIHSRLGHAIEERRASRSRAGRLAGLIDAVRLEGVFLAVGLAYFIENWIWALNLCSVMLFILWFRRGRA